MPAVQGLVFEHGLLRRLCENLVSGVPGSPPVPNGRKRPPPPFHFNRTLLAHSIPVPSPPPMVLAQRHSARADAGLAAAGEMQGVPPALAFCTYPGVWVPQQGACNATVERAMAECALWPAAQTQARYSRRYWDGGGRKSVSGREKGRAFESGDGAMA
jgi:hypothetical protein